MAVNLFFLLEIGGVTYIIRMDSNRVVVYKIDTDKKVDDSDCNAMIFHWKIIIAVKIWIKNDESSNSDGSSININYQLGSLIQ